MSKNREQSNDFENEEIAPIIEVVARDILVEKVRKLHEKPSAAIGILLAGDRIDCCDEGIIMQKNENLIGVATIAPEGEAMSGQPTIVALYVAPEYRNKGYGAQILKKAVERCIERGFSNIRMDVMSLNAKKIINKLPPELQEKINVYDWGSIMDTF